MNFSIKRSIYESLPVPIKRLFGLIPFPWLAGSAYRVVYERGLWLDRAAYQDLRRYQEWQLGKVLRFAVDRVPVYRPLRSVVDRHRPFEALKAFPFLTKNDIQADQQGYLPRDLEKIPHYETTTGGTSGNKLKIYLDTDSQSVEMGFMHRQWKRVGYSPRHRKATFRGVSFPCLKPGVFWRHNPIYNELQFSPFHMSESNLGAYVRQIIRFKPSYYHGYPSALDVLAEFVLKHNLMAEIPRVKAALLCSEEVFREQRERIELAFHTRVFSWYGHSERVVLAGECELNSTYHHFPDYGFLEIVDNGGQLCEKEGDRGEIVGTGFYNRCMPLIRYRTGDYATRLSSGCDCGRAWDRFANVESRWEQKQLVGRSGLKIPIKRYSGSALKRYAGIFERVIRCQYYQDSPGVCTLNVVAAPDFTEQDRLLIEKAYNSLGADDIRFIIRIVDNIPLTERGKLKLLDSRLDNQLIGD